MKVVQPDLYRIDLRQGGLRIVLGMLEHEIMHILWQAGVAVDASSIRTRLELRGYDRAITTVDSTLTRMLRKRLISRSSLPRKEGAAYEVAKYRTILDEAQFAKWLEESMTLALETV
jgi:predicted transcriptional regulator